MDVFSLLKQDHQEMRGLLQHLLNHPNPSQESIDDLQEALADLIINHTQMEEEFLYKDLQPVEAARELIADSYQDHHVLNRLLYTFSQFPMSSPEWRESGTQMLQILESHVQMEETRLFPIMQQVFDQAKLQAIFEEMLTFREKHLIITDDLPY